MAAQNMSRKRPAPGAEPVGYPQSMQQTVNSYIPSADLGPQLSNDEFLQWGQATAQPQNAFSDQSNFNVAPPTYHPNNVQMSNQLARRPMSQVITRPNGNSNQWIPDTNPTPAAAMNPGWEDDIEELKEKAQVAERDAAAKRKQIPPFVLKLRK